MRFRGQTSEIEIYREEIHLFDTHGGRVYCANFGAVFDSSQLRNGKRSPRCGDGKEQEEGGGDAKDKGAVMQGNPFGRDIGEQKKKATSNPRTDGKRGKEKEENGRRMGR